MSSNARIKMGFSFPQAYTSKFIKTFWKLSLNFLCIKM